MSGDYFVIRVDSWKLWVAPFIVLILMLVHSNLEIQRQKAVNDLLLEVATVELLRLQREVKRCRESYRMAEYRRRELLGLWEGEGDLTVAAYENPPRPVDDPGGLSRRREELQ
jgi:hypothetical protein